MRRAPLWIGVAALAFAGIPMSSTRSTADATPNSAGTVLFESRKGETWEIPGRLRLGAMSPSGANARIVSDLGAGIEHAELSPDHRRVGLTRTDGRLVVIDVKTGARVTIARDVNSWTWSANGRRIAYSSGTSSGRARQIYVVGIDGSNPTQITHNSRPTSWKYFDPYNLLAWSPDGLRIAFANWQNYSGHGPLTGGRLYTISPNGSHQRQVTKFAKYGSGWAFVPYTISWSPTSRELAVASQATAGVLVVRGARAAWVRGSDCCVGPRYLAWSPDGSRIAFLGADTSTSDSGGIASVHGSHSTIVPGSENSLTTDPTWSPAGDRMAFLECRYDDSYDGHGGCTLNMSDRDGRHRTRINTTAKVDGLLGWSR